LLAVDLVCDRRRDDAGLRVELPQLAAAARLIGDELALAGSLEQQATALRVASSCGMDATMGSSPMFQNPPDRRV